MSILHHIIMSIAKPTPIPDYLCFTALEAGQFTLTIPAAVTPTYLSYVEWSKDGRNWHHTDISSSIDTIDVEVAQGDKVYWRGSGLRMAVGYADGRFSNFSSTCQFDLSGDIRSILYLNDFSVTTTTQQYCFMGLFRGSSVIDASNLRLALTGHSAYMYCFRNCTQLVHAPSLMEGDTIMTWQFHTTYQDCTSLVTGTDIQATSVAPAGCYYTYRNCTSLVKAPDISSVISIAKQGFYAMFYSCSSLNYVKCLASSFYEDDTASNAATYAWLSGVSSTGTFIQASGVTWPRGASGIPAGWVDVEKRTMPQGYKQVLGIYSDGLSGASLDIGHPVNMKYDRIEVAFKQDEISNGMVLQSNANVNGKCWFYNYNASGLAAKPFNIYTQDANGNQRVAFGNTIYSPLDTAPHYLDFSGDGTKWELTHNGVTRTPYTGYISDLPESCESNTILFGSSVPYKGWIYYFRNYDKDRTLLADFVSCIRESDDCAGYYDFVTNTFKTSNNHSRLTAGEEI